MTQFISWLFRVKLNQKVLSFPTLHFVFSLHSEKVAWDDGLFARETFGHNCLMLVLFTLQSSEKESSDEKSSEKEAWVDLFVGETLGPCCFPPRVIGCLRFVSPFLLDSSSELSPFSSGTIGKKIFLGRFCLRWSPPDIWLIEELQVFKDTDLEKLLPLMNDAFQFEIWLKFWSRWQFFYPSSISRHHSITIHNLIGGSSISINWSRN